MTGLGDDGLDDGSGMTGVPLAGRRVVITRSADQAGELVERLTALGAEPLVVPLIQIVEPADGGRALGEALGRLGDFDWLVVTSPNGASRVGEALAALGVVIAGRPRLAAVGLATATALQTALPAALRAALPAALPADGTIGLTAVDLVAERQIAEGLVDAFPPGDGSGRVLIAQAESARSVLADGLVAKGWQVETVVAYRTVPARPGARELLAVLSADAVLFASGSAVRSWLQVFGVATPAVVVTIGPATAAVAEQIGLKVDAIATDHSVGGLLTSLLTHLSISD